MLIKERLSEALANKENDIKSFIWKGKKIKNKDGNYEQSSTRLVDCDVPTLKQYLDYCDVMLHNISAKTPGRLVFLDIIRDARQRCNVELFLRWLYKENNITRYSFMNIILTFIQNNSIVDKSTLTLNDIVGKCPLEFQELPVNLVLDGCMDMLGSFKKGKDYRYLTTSFLLRQGVWPTEEERKEFSRNKIKLTGKTILEYLELTPKYSVRINSKGLSLKQMKSLVSLKTTKYSEMSTMQLELLRNRVLFALENEIKFQINQWKMREHQIKLVLQSKGVNVD